MGKTTLFLPDFIIIGANKAGTTSLSMYLSQHPEIKMSSIKEPMFFTSDPARISAARGESTLATPYFAITLKEYSSMFEDADKKARIFGEASTAYLANPSKSSTLIKKIVPDIKLICVLREPASRAVSAYKMCFGNGIEKRPFSEIVKSFDAEKKILAVHGVKEYIRNGLYSQLLKPYINLFERENLLFIKYDDFNQSPGSIMDKILNFLGLQPWIFNIEKRFNTSKEHKPSCEIEKKDVLTLKKFFKEEVLSTQELTGLDLRSWIEEI